MGGEKEALLVNRRRDRGFLYLSASPRACNNRQGAFKIR